MLQRRMRWRSGVTDEGSPEDPAELSRFGGPLSAGDASSSSAQEPEARDQQLAHRLSRSAQPIFAAISPPCRRARSGLITGTVLTGHGPSCIMLVTTTLGGFECFRGLSANPPDHRQGSHGVGPPPAEEVSEQQARK